MGKDILSYFPLVLPPRPGQIAALEFIERMVREYDARDIVIEAPTGAGKSAIGAAACHWAGDLGSVAMDENDPPLLTKAGGYYLVAQKILEDQIANDVKKNFRFKDFADLRSSSNYVCDAGKATPEQLRMIEMGEDVEHKHVYSCQMGMLDKRPRCSGRKSGNCPYMVAKQRFEGAIFSLTNYPWFLTERLFVGKLEPRNVLILDEAHGLEKHLLKFGEIELSEELLKQWDVRNLQVPEIDDKLMFVKWLEMRYLPKIQESLADYEQQAKMADPDDPENKTLAQRITALQNQVQKTVACIDGVRTEPGEWVYWYDQTEKNGNIVYCKPLNAAPYMNLIRSGAFIRVYMSAYLGSKDLFCRSLGLDPEYVAWKRLPSEFPKENRPVIMGLVGSMSRKNQDATFKPMMRVIEKILSQHAEEKGVIHCHSYVLGERIAEALKRTPHARRVLFPKKDQRDELFKRHCEDPAPTVLLSPSMTEGFDFKDDLARWQIIAKIPYPYLGDQQVAAKKDRDPEWYALQTAMTIIQAAGRVCRSKDDHGYTYVLDSDFKLLYDKHRHLFPGWFQEAIVWT